MSKLSKLNNQYMLEPDAYLVSNRLQDLISYYGIIDLIGVLESLQDDDSMVIDPGIYEYSVATQIKTHLFNIRNTYSCYNEILFIVFPELKIGA